MTVYEKVNANISYNRAKVNSSNLNLNFDLNEHFCAAAYHAAQPLAKLLLAQNGVGARENPSSLADRFSLYITPDVAEVLSGTLSRAIHDEAERIGKGYPKIIHHQDKMDQLVSGCLSHESRASAVVCRPQPL